MNVVSLGIRAVCVCSERRVNERKREREKEIVPVTHKRVIVKRVIMSICVCVVFFLTWRLFFLVRSYTPTFKLCRSTYLHKRPRWPSDLVSSTFFILPNHHHLPSYHQSIITIIIINPLTCFPYKQSQRHSMFTQTVIKEGYIAGNDCSLLEFTRFDAEKEAT